MKTIVFTRTLIIRLIISSIIIWLLLNWFCWVIEYAYPQIRPITSHRAPKESVRTYSESTSYRLPFLDFAYYCDAICVDFGILSA